MKILIPTLKESLNANVPITPNIIWIVKTGFDTKREVYSLVPYHPPKTHLPPVDR